LNALLVRLVRVMCVKLFRRTNAFTFLNYSTALIDRYMLVRTQIEIMRRYLSYCLRSWLRDIRYVAIKK